MTDHTRRKRTARELTGRIMLWKDIRRNSELTFWSLRYLSQATRLQLFHMATREQHQKAETAPWPLLVQVCFLALCFLVLVCPYGLGFTFPPDHFCSLFHSKKFLPPLHNSAKKLSGELGRSQSSVFLGGLSGLWVPDHRSLMALQKATRRSIFR